jgi:hypothetical protein
MGHGKSAIIGHGHGSPESHARTRAGSACLVRVPGDCQWTGRSHAFLDDTPTSKLIRQILGAVLSSTKRWLSPSSRAPGKRKRVITGKKVEGRKSHAELRPDLVALVRQFRRRRPKGGQRSLQEISSELAARGHRPFSADQYAMGPPDFGGVVYTIALRLLS